MKSLWQTAWRGHDIVVYRDDVECDRLPAASIERVVLLYRGAGDNPGDVVRAVVEMTDDYALFGADTGFAGRVTFERDAFWTERDCVYWADAARARLPLRLRTGRWFLPAATPALLRVAKSELAAMVEHWPLQGPQTWAQRKRQRIARLRPFSDENVTRQRA